MWNAMSPADEEVLSVFLRAYGRPVRPRSFGNPSHCEECFEANELLMDRTPDDLDPDELEEPSRSWFFSWMGTEGWRYFLPGFVRVALSDPQRRFHFLIDQVADLDRAGLASLDRSQREALFEVLDYGRARGYASDDWQRSRLRQALARFEI